MEIIGYSERGIINALIFSIGKDKSLMDKFFQLLDIQELKGVADPIDYEILLEQSFSDFGDADLIIIMKYPDCQKIIFIEGKVKTFQTKNWSLKKQFAKYKTGKYNGYSSNLFYQLYLKRLLFKNINNLIWDEDKIINCNLFRENCGIRDRKIGKNQVVWKALKKIYACNEAFYVGLVPSTSSKEEHIEYDKTLNFKINYLTWDKVEAFCDTIGLEQVKRIFDFNKEQIY